jgi:hypothetical protein
VKRKDLEDLVPALEAEDAFVRLEAERRLRDILQLDFGYRWDGAPEARAAAITRLKAWEESGRKQEKARRQAGAGLAAVNLDDLKGMTPEQVEQHLQKLLSKASMVAGLGLGRRKCEGCAKRHATVEIVEVMGGKARRVRRLCDECATGGQAG